MVAYKDEQGVGQFKMSFCAYFDVLGFSQKIKNEDLKFFNIYLKVLNDEMRFLVDNPRFSVKVFTDNFVIGVPWHFSDAESELGELFEILSRIQFKFAIADIFVRGAICISKLYMDESTVLGPALIEAYNLENLENYPRIILSDDTVGKVQEHISYYSYSRDAPQTTEYLVDIDGKYFVNYLKFIKDDNFQNPERAKRNLKSHKLSIERNLKFYQNNFRIFDKFLWVARYHNYFCENFMPKIRPETLNGLLVDGDLIRLDISRPDSD